MFALAAFATPAAQAQTYTVLHTFQYFPNGALPCASLYRDASGDFYGTTSGGGTYNAGVVFKLDQAGHETVLYSFTGGADGGYPCAGVVMDSAGNLYGSTAQGGISNLYSPGGAGVVYKIDTSGLYTVLYTFTGGTGGGVPYAVIPDAAGNLYGTAAFGGVRSPGSGVVFKISPSGQETVLYSFTGKLDGGRPASAVTMDAAGNLYGTTGYGGTYGKGVAYKLSPSGQETVLHSFAYSGDISHFPSGVILDAAGNVYGGMVDAIYKLDPAGNFTALLDLQGQIKGSPTGLARDASGNLYFATNGTRKYPSGAVFKLETNGNLAALLGFGGSISPQAGHSNGAPILDAAGNLFGMEAFDGTAGIVYEIETNGKVETLYDFEQARGGTTATSGLIQDAAGNWYGTTVQGGGSQNAGVVYKLSPTGQETVLHSFKGESADGASPKTGVVMDQAGNLYGTTAAGGANNQGVVYKLTPSGKETILHSFTGGTDGGVPNGLAIDSVGNLYGTASQGGIGVSGYQGLVFELDVAGNFSVLYSFAGFPDGSAPQAGVVLDAAGNVYGTTSSGGESGDGTIFKIDANGDYSVLYSLSYSDGSDPVDAPTLDAAGNLYGTCSNGGPNRGGTLFKLDAAGNFSVLYSFFGGIGLGSPLAGVVLDAAGNLYGTQAQAGGCPGNYVSPGICGAVYMLDTSGDYSVLYNFTGGADSASPTAPVALDGAGHLYGTAAGLFPYVPGGYPAGGGVAFKITLPPASRATPSKGP